MITLALFGGAAVGLGVWLLVDALVPRRRPLGEALAALQPRSELASIVPVVPPQGRLGHIVEARLRQWAERLMPAAVGSVASSLGTDLRVLDRTAEDHVIVKMLSAIGGLLLPGLVVGLLVAVGVHVPWQPSLAVALACFVLGWLLPDGSVRTEAERRRAEFRSVVATWVDLVAVALDAGAGVEEAVTSAARAGSGWAFAHLGRALETTRFGAETAWEALGRLGDELGVVELTEISASVGLAGTAGAPVRASLAARAEAMRAAQLVEADARAKRATDLMDFPVVVIGFGFVVFIGYAALAAIK